jgi:GH24 family phage-related lysozyme (muramidase)
MQFIQNGSGNFTWEWFALHCKWDSKQYSRWHWTRCYNPWEAVTQEKADQEFANHLEPLFELVDNNTCFNDNQKIALVSYMYNVGRYAMSIDKYIKMCSHKDIKYIMSVYGYTSNWVRLKWLVNRRFVEINLYNK